MVQKWHQDALSDVNHKGTGCVGALCQDVAGKAIGCDLLVPAPTRRNGWAVQGVKLLKLEWHQDSLGDVNRKAAGCVGALSQDVAGKAIRGGLLLPATTRGNVWGVQGVGVDSCDRRAEGGQGSARICGWFQW